MTNFKLNRMSISILGAFFAPVLVASGSVPYEGFSQEASGTDASQAASQDAGSNAVKKDEVLDEFGTFEIDDPWNMHR